MAPFLVPDPLLSVYEVEADSPGTGPQPRSQAAPSRLQSSNISDSVGSSLWRSSEDMERARLPYSRKPHSRSCDSVVDMLGGCYNTLELLGEMAAEENAGSGLPVIAEDAEHREYWTRFRKICALVKTPVTELHDWKGRRIERMVNKKYGAKAADSTETLTAILEEQQSACSCGPAGTCKLYKASEDAKEAKEAEDATVADQVEKNTRYSRHISSALGRTGYLVHRKSSRRKGKEKEVIRRDDSAASRLPSRRLPQDEDDNSSPLLRVPWYPEFQYQPRPLCNCLLFSPKHKFSDGEIQKMRWFLDRMTRGLATPDEWFLDETQSAGGREAYRWNFVHPLRSQDINSPPMTLLNKDWIIVQLTTTFARPSHPTPKSRRASSPPQLKSGPWAIEPTFQPSLKLTPSLATRVSDDKPRDTIRFWSAATLAPAVIKENTTTSNTPSQHSFNGPQLEIDKSGSARCQVASTPNNSPPPASNSSCAVASNDIGRTSISSNIANLKQGDHQPEGNLLLEYETLNDTERCRRQVSTDSGYGSMVCENHQAAHNSVQSGPKCSSL